MEGSHFNASPKYLLRDTQACEVRQMKRFCKNSPRTLVLRLRCSRVLKRSFKMRYIHWAYKRQTNIHWASIEHIVYAQNVSTRHFSRHASVRSLGRVYRHVSSRTSILCKLQGPSRPLARVSVASLDLSRFFNLSIDVAAWQQEHRPKQPWL